MNWNPKTFWRSALAFVAATLMTCAFAASIAFADNEVRAETVRFADLDTGTPAGARALYRRIHAAVQRVCFEADPRSTHACSALAERRAVEQVNLPLLTDYYQQSAEAGDKP